MRLVVGALSDSARLSRALLRLVRPLVIAAVLGAAPAAWAQADDATRSAARTLGYEGINDYQAGNYPSAVDKLDRAYRALKVPTLGLWSGRALEKTGRLVAASERLLEVTRLDPNTGSDVDVQKKAQADAQTEQALLQRRIPHLVIELTGAGAAGASVTVNGSAIPSALIGVKRPVDPGSVVVQAQNGDASTGNTVVVAEGETKTLSLELGLGTGGTATTAPPPAGNGAATPSARDDKEGGGSGRRVIGWAVFGAGAAGVVAGAVTGGLAMSSRSSMNGCEGNACPESERDNVEYYNQLRTISTIGFIAGGVLAAGGLALVLTAPKSTAQSGAPRAIAYRVSPFFVARGGGVFLSVER